MAVGEREVPFWSAVVSVRQPEHPSEGTNLLDSSREIGGNNNDNSGVFVRFRDPRLPDPAPDLSTRRTTPLLSLCIPDLKFKSTKRRAAIRVSASPMVRSLPERGHLQNKIARHGAGATGL